jgi:hypothetical protein
VDRPRPGWATTYRWVEQHAVAQDEHSKVFLAGGASGHASSEGTPDHNFKLTDRRVARVAAALDDAKLGWRVIDPEVSTEDHGGCQMLGLGKWSCGEEKADQTRVVPSDRNVTIILYRRLVFEPRPPARPTWPALGLPWPSLTPGPF